MPDDVVRLSAWFDAHMTLNTCCNGFIYFHPLYFCCLFTPFPPEYLTCIMCFREYSALCFFLWQMATWQALLLNNPSVGGSQNLLRVDAFWKSAYKLKGQTLNSDRESSRAQVVGGTESPRRDQQTRSALDILNTDGVKSDSLSFISHILEI